MFQKVIRNSHCEEFGALEKKHQNEFRDLFFFLLEDLNFGERKESTDHSTYFIFLLKKLQNNDRIINGRSFKSG